MYTNRLFSYNILIKIRNIQDHVLFFSMINPASGTLLISDPFLKDPHFMRTVVFLCEHNTEGSFGFVINRPFEQTLDEFLPNMYSNPLPVFYGGPVQTDTLHFLHKIPELIPGGQQVVEGVYWGGEFETVIDLIHQRLLKPNDVRFFLGYSGWSGGQLQEEMESKSWLVTDASQPLIFDTAAGDIWPAAIKKLDEKYHPIIYYPIDPTLN